MKYAKQWNWHTILDIIDEINWEHNDSRQDFEFNTFFGSLLKVKDTLLRHIKRKTVFCPQVAIELYLNLWKKLA